MSARSIIVLLVLCACAMCAVPAWAQTTDPGVSQQERLADERREKAANLEPYRVSPIEARIRALEEARFPSNIFVKGFNGIRPVVGGMPSGSGLVGGVGYVRGLDSERYRAAASATYSTRGFRQVSGRIDVPTRQSGRPVRGFVSAAYEDFPGLRFFGVGNDSRDEDRVFFGQTTKRFGGGLAGDLTRFVSVEADARHMIVELGPANRQPSLESSGLPIDRLFAIETAFNVYGGAVTLNLFDRYEAPPAGLDISVGGWRYDDRDRQLGSFTRVTGQVRAQIPLGVRSRRLALRVRTSHSLADAGHVVPIHLMETIGGAASLRGYREYRFRDARNLLLSAEYRWEVWTYMDLALFYDAGKVFEDAGDMDFEQMHSGYGFGMRVRVPEDVFFNIDLAKSPEGYRLHIGGGPRF